MRSPALVLVLALAACSACSKGDLLPVGTAAPDRALVDESGAQRNLAGFRGKPLLVFFYPKDSSPGCTREACAFRDAWERYTTAGIQVVGVSTQSPESHREFIAEHDLPFPLLSDEEGALTEAFGVNTHLGLASRVSFLLDADGVIRAVFRDVDPGVHANDVLAEAARLGLVTPASPGSP